MELLRAKGTRDFLGEQAALRQHLFTVLRSTFKRYGFTPLETPILERLDVLSSKYAGGEEILREIFRLKDQGNRDLALRYDLTVPMARVLGMNPDMRLPFKRYELGSVFRDGPLKAGRYRVFTQCDVDVVGIPSVRGDAEILNIAADVFAQLKLPITIKLNHIGVLHALMKEAGIPPEKHEGAILALDKLTKIGDAGVMKELQEERKLTPAQAKKLLSLVKVEGSNEKRLATLKRTLKNVESLAQLEEMLPLCPSSVVIEPSLARGLAYYTGPIFEVYATKSSITSSIAAGGRWDKMIGKFLGRGDYPATGISFGVDVILDVLTEMKVHEHAARCTAFIVPIKCFPAAWPICQRLRQAGIAVDIDMNDRSVGKNLEYCNKTNLPYAIIIGEDELKQKKIKLRDMKSGDEQMLDIADTIKALSKTS